MASFVNKNWKRKLFALSRVIHIYTSTLLLGLLIFFCLTGVTLNHRWYGKSDSIAAQIHSLPAGLLEEWGLFDNKDWSPDITSISRYIKTQFKLASPHSVNVEQDFDEVALEFKAPSGFASVLLNTADRTITIETESGSALGILNDLHKGRHSGPAWFWLIDVSAVLISLFAITGMIILFQGKKHRIVGTALAGLGFITPALIYLMFVPNLNFI